MWSWLFLCSFGLFGAITPSHFHFLPWRLMVHSERKCFCKQQDQCACLADLIETQEKWGKVVKSVGVNVLKNVEPHDCVFLPSSWSRDRRECCISHGKEDWVLVRREFCQLSTGCQVLDILQLYFHKIHTFLVLRPSYEAGRRTTRPCQLHVTAWRDSLVSKSTENSPQRWTCWLSEGVFVATELREALSSLLLSSASTCPYPRLQSDHWRMPASCYSHFSGPHVGSMKTVTDQRL